MDWIPKLLKDFFDGYNLVIFSVGVFNSILIIIIGFLIKTINGDGYLCNVERVNNKHKKNTSTEDQKREHEDKIKKLLGHINNVYSFFSTVVTIFPLLGMLGTVISLYKISLGNNASNDAVSVEDSSFFLALSSTAAGILWAIVGKIEDALISPKITDANKEYDLLVARNSRSGEDE